MHFGAPSRLDQRSEQHTDVETVSSFFFYVRQKRRLYLPPVEGAIVASRLTTPGSLASRGLELNIVLHRKGQTPSTILTHGRILTPRGRVEVFSEYI